MRNWHHLMGCAGAAALAMGALGCPMRTIDTKPVLEGMVSTRGVAIWERDSAFMVAAGKPFGTPFFAERCVHTATAQNHQTALQWGARPVVVKVPSLSQPIYGLLAFCKVPEEATDAASRSYNIVVPESYVDATDGNRVSVVYEPTSYANFPAWQLWLSRSPILWQ